MATMQDHPIDLVRDQMALVARTGGRGLLGLGCGLALIGLLWLGSLKPADAAGLEAGPMIVASALVNGHLGAPSDGQGASVTTAVVSVCRLVIDPEAEVPFSGTCALPQTTMARP